MLICPNCGAPAPAIKMKPDRNLGILSCSNPDCNYTDMNA
jgi:hypothetical protein